MWIIPCKYETQLTQRLTIKQLFGISVRNLIILSNLYLYTNDSTESQSSCLFFYVHYDGTFCNLV